MTIALATCTKLPDWEVDDRPLHRALHKRGVEARLAVWDDPDVDWAQFDAVLIRTTWDYMDRRPQFIAWAEQVEGVTRLFNSAGMVKWNTHKRYLRDLADSGITITPTVWLDQGDDIDLHQVIEARGWRKAIIKPAIGATARETVRFDADIGGLETAQTHLDRTLAAEDMMIQPYLSRVETEGEISAIFIEGEISHCVRKIPAPGDYRVQDEFGAHDEPIEFTPAELAQAQRILEVIEEDLLYARTDFLRDDAGWLVLSEFEAVEPSLFFRHGPRAADRLAEALCRRLR